MEAQPDPAVGRNGDRDVERGPAIRTRGRLRRVRSDADEARLSRGAVVSNTGRQHVSRRKRTEEGHRIGVPGRTRVHFKRTARGHLGGVLTRLRDVAERVVRVRRGGAGRIDAKGDASVGVVNVARNDVARCVTQRCNEQHQRRVGSGVGRAHLHLLRRAHVLPLTDAAARGHRIERLANRGALLRARHGQVVIEHRVAGDRRARSVLGRGQEHDHS